MEFVVLGVAFFLGGLADWGVALGLMNVDQTMFWMPVRNYVNEVMVGWQQLLF